MAIVSSLARAPGREVTRNARLYAAVTAALNDTEIAVFESKYFFNFWRPLTAIRNGDRDDNAATERDPGWLPLIVTPIQPEYPCAHCMIASTIATIIRIDVGTEPLPTLSTISNTLPGVTRHWTRTEDVVQEVSECAHLGRRALPILGGGGNPDGRAGRRARGGRLPAPVGHFFAALDLRPASKSSGGRVRCTARLLQMSNTHIRGNVRFRIVAALENRILALALTEFLSLLLRHKLTGDAQREILRLFHYSIFREQKNMPVEQNLILRRFVRMALFGGGAFAAGAMTHSSMAQAQVAAANTPAPSPVLEEVVVTGSRASPRRIWSRSSPVTAVTSE